MAERKVYTLSQIGSAIKKRIEEATHGEAYWIKAEIASIRCTQHAYLELAQHRDGEKVAVMRGTIWSSSLQQIRHALGAESGNILKDGVEILFLAKPRYHLVYGLSLAIEEIDLDFNISGMERRKRETIATLKAEGLFHRNRLLPLPIVIQRIALISSAGTAAYADLMQHLENNEHGYRFHVQVFNASVQGDAAAAELRAAVSAIDPPCFDAVVVIRGGGSKLDLEPFNDLELARLVATLPIPVLTGIGHEVDISVLDLIANSPHKTPTAAADFIVDRMLYFETGMTGMLSEIHNTMLAAFSRHKETLGAWREMATMRPAAHCRVADIGDVPFRSRYSLAQSIEDIETFYRGLVDRDIRPLSAGGDHSITYPILKAVGERCPVGMVHIDAHCDTGGIYDDTKFHHGGPFRYAVLDGVLDPERTIQIGIRGGSNLIWEFSNASGMTVLNIEDFTALGVEAVAHKAREVVGEGPVYLSIDVDGFDPAFAPGTGTPEVGGITPREGLELLWRLRGLDIVGADVVEVAPQYDPTTNTAQLGAQLLFEELALMTLGRTRRFGVGAPP